MNKNGLINFMIKVKYELNHTFFLFVLVRDNLTKARNTNNFVLLIWFLDMQISSLYNFYHFPKNTILADPGC